MSALGQKRTWRDQIAMSALPPIADIAERDRNVRFVPEADIAFVPEADIATLIRSLRRRGRTRSAARQCRAL